MKFDEVVLIDEAPNRRQGGHDPKRVADIRIVNAVQALSVLEIDGDARAVLADQIARHVERAGRIDNLIADRNAPARPVPGDTRQVRTIKPDAHDGGVAVAAEFCFANGVARVVGQRGEIERGFGIEDDPERIGAAENGGRRRLENRTLNFRWRLVASVRPQRRHYSRSRLGADTGAGAVLAACAGFCAGVGGSATGAGFGAEVVGRATGAAGAIGPTGSGSRGWFRCRRLARGFCFRRAICLGFGSCLRFGFCLRLSGFGRYSCLLPHCASVAAIASAAAFASAADLASRLFSPRP